MQSGNHRPVEPPSLCARFILSSSFSVVHELGKGIEERQTGQVNQGNHRAVVCPRLHDMWSHSWADVPDQDCDCTPAYQLICLLCTDQGGFLQVIYNIYKSPVAANQTT